jgi:cytochrome c oxidase assembly protein subunit 11
MQASKNQRLLVRLSIAAVLMFGFGYALVPLYNVFCKVTGVQGKTAQNLASAPTPGMIDKERNIVVEFVTQINGGNAPLTFSPRENSVTVHPGELRKTTFFVRNHTNNTITTQAIPSISPGEHAEFFKKTECFCFQKQNIEKGATVEMPLVFYIDPEISKDVKRLTLSYTLFDVTKTETRNGG